MLVLFRSMFVETNNLKIELEPDLLTDEQVARIEKLLGLVLHYESEKHRLEAELSKGARRKGSRKGQ